MLTCKGIRSGTATKLKTNCFAEVEKVMKFFSIFFFQNIFINIFVTQIKSEKKTFFFNLITHSVVYFVSTVCQDPQQL